MEASAFSTTPQHIKPSKRAHNKVLMSIKDQSPSRHFYLHKFSRHTAKIKVHNSLNLSKLFWVKPKTHPNKIRVSHQRTTLKAANSRSRVIKNQVNRISNHQRDPATSRRILVCRLIATRAQSRSNLQRSELPRITKLLPIGNQQLVKCTAIQISKSHTSNKVILNSHLLLIRLGRVVEALVHK